MQLSRLQVAAALLMRKYTVLTVKESKKVISWILFYPGICMVLVFSVDTIFEIFLLPCIIVKSDIGMRQRVSFSRNTP